MNYSNYGIPIQPIIANDAYIRSIRTQVDIELSKQGMYVKDLYLDKSGSLVVTANVTTHKCDRCDEWKPAPTNSYFTDRFWYCHDCEKVRNAEAIEVSVNTVNRLRDAIFAIEKKLGIRSRGWPLSERVNLCPYQEK